jgi:hypothetical protein
MSETGKALDKLINEKWRTRFQTRIEKGRLAFRGFRGEYRISVNGLEPVMVRLFTEDSNKQTLNLEPRK